MTNVFIPEINREVPTEFEYLIIELRKEAESELRQGFKHGTVSCRINHKCTGPMCMKSARDTWRINRAKRNIASGGKPKPYSRSALYLYIDAIVESFQNYYDSELVLVSSES